MNKQEQAELDQKLIAASSFDDLETVKKLISLGADIHVENGQALIYAASNGCLKVLKHLVGQGVDVQSQGNKSLIYASYDGYLDTIVFLIEHGADIKNNKDEMLICSSKEGKLNTVKYLIIEHDCDPKVALGIAEKNEEYEVVEWCEKYIQSKTLTDKLECDLQKNNKDVKVKKI